MILQFDIHLDGFDLYHFQIISFRCKYCAINVNSLFRCIFLFHNCFAYQNIYSIHHRKNTLRFFRCHTITILWTFLLGKVQFSQEARCTSWPELITQAAVISRKAFNVKLGLRRPVGDRGANRGCVCLIYNSRASQPALANVYTPFFFQNWREANDFLSSHAGVENKNTYCPLLGILPATHPIFPRVVLSFASYFIVSSFFASFINCIDDGKIFNLITSWHCRHSVEEYSNTGVTVNIASKSPMMIRECKILQFERSIRL